MNRTSALLLATLALVLCVNAVSSISPPNHHINVNSHSNLIPVSTDESIVYTLDGALQGKVMPEARAFLGVPFAQPPVGSLRWQSPVAASSWNSTGAPLNVTVYKPGCPQNCLLPEITCPTSFSEDCLYLNVWTPRLSAINSPLPVMAFLPGGRFEQGGPGTVVYDSGQMVNRTDVIVITIGFRLGVLGFLVTDDLPGNFGFQDQLLALQWIQDNIKAFGGDPTSVTLYGQSAGGTSTAAHLVSPASVGLFSKAIIESNPFSLVLKDTKASASLGKIFCEDVGCDKDCDTSCLMSADVDSIVAAQMKSQNKVTHDILSPLELFYPWTPCVDGVLLPANPYNAIMDNQVLSKVPVMLGTVANESVIFIYELSSNPIDVLDYTGILGDVFNIQYPKVAAHYPLDPVYKNDTRVPMSRIGTDYVFGCPMRSVARGLADTVGVDTYLYWFDHILSFDQAWGANYSFCYDMVCHASELPFVFDSASAAGFNYTAQEEVIVTNMITHWTNFAKFGTPNAPAGSGTPDVPYWPLYNTTADISMRYTTNYTAPMAGLDSDNCDFWDATPSVNGPYQFS